MGQPWFIHCPQCNKDSDSKYNGEEILRWVVKHYPSIKAAIDAANSLKDATWDKDEDCCGWFEVHLELVVTGETEAFTTELISFVGEHRDHGLILKGEQYGEARISK